MAEIFDDWAEKYDLWFETPMGRLIKGYESKLILRIHFEKNDDPDMARKIEKSGSEKGLNTGAFLVARWIKSG